MIRRARVYMARSRSHGLRYSCERKSRMKVNILLSVLTIFTVSTMAHAVTPAPDGGYPGLNTAEGQNALLGLTTGTANTAVGWFSLKSNTDGTFNTAVGAATLLSDVGNQSTGEGVNNTAIGAAALLFNTTGFDNTAVGAAALLHNIDGSLNTATGVDALFSNTTGFGNIGVGVFSGGGVTTANNVIAIGAGGANIDNSCFIGQIYSNIQPVIGIDPDYVTITSNGRLGRSNFNGSSRRFKHDIKPMDEASAVIFALKPVSFRYNKEYDSAERPSFGLIAEEVAQVDSDLVGRNRKGEPESVRYEQINAMLLNEFLKEHGKVQELEATVTEQKKGMAVLTAQLKEQAAQIQKVSAQLEMSNFTKRVVFNNP